MIRAVLFAIATVASRMGFRASRLANRGSIASGWYFARPASEVMPTMSSLRRYLSHGWTWRLADKRKDGLPATFRTPPAPYRERAYAGGAGFCCVCRRPVYRFGWHVDLWKAG